MGKYDLTGIREQQQEEDDPATPPAKAKTVTAVRPSASVAVREPGKRSNPDFSRTTVYIRDTTKLKAVRLLQDLKDERDLSDLIESLLSTWASKHSST